MEGSFQGFPQALYLASGAAWVEQTSFPKSFYGNPVCLWEHQHLPLTVSLS
jgi:hypothetical protein